MFHSYSKKFLAGSLFLLLIFGIGTFSTVKAYGQTEIPAEKLHEVHSDWHEQHEKRACMIKGTLMNHASALLGIDQKTLIQLQKDKTLKEIAADKGISEKEFIAKLQAMYSKEIDQAAANGKLNRSQAANIKKNLEKKLTFIINHKADGKFQRKHRFMMVGLKNMAGIIGITEDQLRNELKAGKSLAEIAESKGISKEELVNKIKVELTPWLTKLVERKHGEM